MKCFEMKRISLYTILCYLLVFVQSFVYSQGIEITNGGSISCTASPTIEINNGEFINNGTYTKASDIVKFSGTTAKSISGTSNTLFNDIIINNSGGITLSGVGTISIGHNLTFSAGLLTTGTNILYVNDNATVTGATTGTYIDGFCGKIGNDAFTFPIGKNGEYAPLSITAPSIVTDQFTASYYKSNPLTAFPTATLGLGIDHISGTEYWILDRTTGSSSVSLSLNFGTRSGEISNLSAIRVAHLTGNVWTDVGNAGTSGRTDSGSVLSTALNSFSPFTTASSTAENSLPISLLYFKPYVVDKEVKLVWETASELNNDFFSIEKTIDGEIWQNIGRVGGAGNSSKKQQYHFTDADVTNGIYFYRLKQTDYNGNYTYSDIENVYLNSHEKNAVDIFPCPVNKDLSISIFDIRSKTIHVKIWSTIGSLLFDEIIEFEQLYSVDLTDYTNGVYFIDVEHDGVIDRKQIIKK
jgi:hypothetical protein